MKTSRILAIMAAASLAALSCTKENISNPAQDGQPDGKISFSAGFEDIATKTNLAQDGAGEYTKMVWSPGDVIGIFDKNGKPQPFTTEAGGASAVFTGAAEAPSDRWYAFYPYREGAELNGGKGIVTRVPEIQYAKKDGVSDNVTILKASCDLDKTSFTFEHVCGLVRVNVPDGCISVTIEFPDAQSSKKNECALTGGFASAGEWSMYATSVWYRSVTLVAPDGGAMSEGNYYIAVLPVNYTGKVMLTMRRNDGKISIKQADGLQVGAGEVRPINVTPVWEEDRGVAIYSTKNIGYWWDGASVKLDEVEGEKVIGSKSIRWELTEEKAWTGYLRFHADKGLLLDLYLNDYALEYYVKADRTALDADTGWQIFYHTFKGAGSLDNKAPILRWSGAENYSWYNGINGLADTDWHRVSIPLKDVFTEDYTLWHIEMHIDPESDSKVAKAKGSVFYVNDVRIIKKTATK